MNTDTQAITFAAGTTGAVASKELFQVTGMVLATVFGVCTTSLTGTGTIQVGAAGSTDAIIGAATGTSIDAGDVFVDETAIGETEEPVSEITWIVTNDADLGYEVVTNTLTAGVITFYCLWYPLEKDAMVVPSGSNISL